MKRKVGLVGQSSLMVSLPSKWTKKQGIVKGDELEVEINDNQLLIYPGKPKKQAKKELSLNIPLSKESATRTILDNAYREGFDKLIVNFPGDEKVLTTIVNRFLLGFDLFPTKKNVYIIESVSEPNYDNVEVILQRQFYVIEEILKQLGQKDISELVFKVQKYDNFLKRCISKNVLEIKSKENLWKFLSQLTHICRLCLHFQKDIEDKLDKNTMSYIDELIDMFKILKSSYLKKDYTLLPKLHKMYWDFNDKKKKLLSKKNGLYVHHLLLIAKTIYIANSPLNGILAVESFSTS